MLDFLKQLFPPIVIKAYRSLRKQESIPDTQANQWKGNYHSWDQAKQNSLGYDNKLILIRCREALLKVRNGDAKYERDSVLFDEIEYSWPVLATLMYVASQNNNELSVLDFGGSLGTTYYQNRLFLKKLKNVKWHIVEQPGFVEQGKVYFEDEVLKFFPTIEASIRASIPDVIILSGVLQYLEKPYDLLDAIISLNCPYIIIDRTSFVENENDVLTVQEVPEQIYKASYPAWFFSLNKFKQALSRYEILASFNAHEGYIMSLENGMSGFYKGFILENKV